MLSLRRHRADSRGLTLIELLVTIALVAVVASIVFPIVFNVVSKAQVQADAASDRERAAFISDWTISGYIVGDGAEHGYPGYIVSVDPDDAHVVAVIRGSYPGSGGSGSGGSGSGGSGDGGSGSGGSGSGGSGSGGSGSGGSGSGGSGSSPWGIGVGDSPSGSLRVTGFAYDITNGTTIRLANLPESGALTGYPVAAWNNIVVGYGSVPDLGEVPVLWDLADAVGNVATPVLLPGRTSQDAGVLIQKVGDGYAAGYTTQPDSNGGVRTIRAWNLTARNTITLDKPAGVTDVTIAAISNGEAFGTVWGRLGTAPMQAYKWNLTTGDATPLARPDGALTNQYGDVIMMANDDWVVGTVSQVLVAWSRVSGTVYKVSEFVSDYPNIGTPLMIDGNTLTGIYGGGGTFAKWDLPPGGQGFWSVLSAVTTFREIDFGTNVWLATPDSAFLYGNAGPNAVTVNASTGALTSRGSLSGCTDTSALGGYGTKIAGTATCGGKFHMMLWNNTDTTPTDPGFLPGGDSVQVLRLDGKWAIGYANYRS